MNVLASVNNYCNVGGNACSINVSVFSLMAARACAALTETSRTLDCVSLAMCQALCALAAWSRP